MCTDRYTLTHLILSGVHVEAEKVLPGRGCELIDVVAQIGNLAWISGFAGGMLFCLVAGDAFAAFVRWLEPRGYGAWREKRDAKFKAWLESRRAD